MTGHFLCPPNSVREAPFETADLYSSISRFLVFPGRTLLYPIISPQLGDFTASMRATASPHHLHGQTVQQSQLPPPPICPAQVWRNHVPIVERILEAGGSTEQQDGESGW